MGFRLGIDGGGTKTDCVLADEAGAILARASAGPSNLLRVGEEAARTALAQAITGAFAAAVLKPGAVEAVCAGLAGAGRVEVRERATALLAGLIPAREIFVVGDSEIALEAAVGPGAGVILIAGTGSMALGRGADGRQARAGGWGPAVSDEGSATDIGRSAVRAVLAARDGRGPETKLTARVRGALGVGSVEDLPLALDVCPFERLAGLFPMVVEAAEAGDRAAGEILEQAAEALAELARTVIHALDFGREPFRVAYTGGIFRRSATLDGALEKRLCALSRNAQPQALDVPPVIGAIRLAERLLLERARTQPR